MGAIALLNKGRAPGPDGLTTEFYPACLEDISSLLTSVFNEGLRKGALHDAFYHGVMLLYKKGDETDLDNWQQLTLMNMDYKTLAKIIE